MADETLVPIRLDAMAVHRLAVAGRLLRSRADADLSDLGVGGPGIGVLLRLVEEDGLTQAELSRRQRVEAPSMCRLVDRLERDGLVERRADPATGAPRASTSAPRAAALPRSAPRWSRASSGARSPASTGTSAAC